jgi:hypothetical protein
MENFILKGTDDTPTIYFSKTEDKFLLEGRSLPEDVNKFYKPFIQWLNEYGKSPNPESIIEMKFEYFNTASSKILLDIFTKLDEIASDKNVSIKINWYYDKHDDDMKDAGEEFAAFIDLPIQIIRNE